MKRILLTCAVMGAALAATSVFAGITPLTFDMSSVPGASIEFQAGGNGNVGGGAFEFIAASNIKQGLTKYNGYDWRITSETGSSYNTAIGLYGIFTPVTWNYGPVTTNLVTGVQSATVTTTGGHFYIWSGNGTPHMLLSGDLSWVDVLTWNKLGGLNASLQINVTGLNVTSDGLASLAKNDLLALAGTGSARLDLSFQFNPSNPLGYLEQNGGATSYSASITVPEPGTIVAGAVALGLALAGLGRRWKRMGSR